MKNTALGINIVLICGTDRDDSRTALITKKIAEHLDKNNVSYSTILLNDIPFSYYENKSYTTAEQHPELTSIQDQKLKPSTHWWIVAPEYNGSYPGVIKMFIDAVSINDKDETFRGKKLALTGVASGRSGNVRGLDHLTTAMNYLGFHILPNRLPISQIERFVDADDNLDPDIEIAISQQVDEFLAY